MSLAATIGKVVGTAALSTLGPVGGVLATAINQYLGDDDKVTSTTPMSVVDSKFSALSETQQASVLSAYYDAKVQINESNNNTDVAKTTVMEESDRLGTSNRPQIALIMTWLLVLITAVFAGAIAYNCVIEKKMPDWELVSALLFLPVWVIQRHFHAEVQSDTVSASRTTGKQIDLPMGTFGRLTSDFLNRKKG